MAVASLNPLRRPVNSSIRQHGDGIEIRTFVREAPGIVVLGVCLLLFTVAGVSALRQASPGGWVALAFAGVVAYPLFRRLGGGGALTVGEEGVTQRIHYETRRAEWAAIESINWDPAGRVVVHQVDGEPVEFVTLGLPDVTWERNLYAWRNDPSLLSVNRIDDEVDRLRHEARLFNASFG